MTRGPYGAITEFAKRHGLTYAEVRKIKREYREQIDRCKDDSARRLLLGKGERVG